MLSTKTAHLTSRVSIKSVKTLVRVRAVLMLSVVCKIIALCVPVYQNMKETHSLAAIYYQVFFYKLFIRFYVLGFHDFMFSACISIFTFFIVYIVQLDTPIDPCNPSPCGANTICKEQNGAGSCKCLQDYFGDPYVGCRPECLMNSDCPSNRACLAKKCRDPCPGSCGINAQCHVINHNPVCTCVSGFVGDALTHCRVEVDLGIIPTHFDQNLFTKDNFTVVIEKPRRHPCLPSPCGPYSICRVDHDRPVCSCDAGYLGAPPNCKPVCIVNSECALNRACRAQKCVDPCIGTCGYNALCKVVAHNPICSCPPGHIGDPFNK